ncbi:cbb3-type cytochrome oxidase assembly protein CcoS [Pusillimonas sp. TS35]|uniref:cbb3-type cytochrome oxidase assembly protein CcoS n=1 Tax=Paracandidimonas lactea TaxID=2895524 RepID=UPI00136B374F|nr:cbb3-type cytochrome oxidase assembly protein CcoS [Paracandidimonas lactea]MYN11891.1 cbb3-type cytochrome oxidase assembly protein CcoS [Pusillimonas sp. TS35]
MSGSLLLLLPISLVMAVLIGAAFWWAIFAGQFDDAGDAGRSILQDDDSTAAAGQTSGGRADMPGDTRR